MVFYCEGRSFASVIQPLINREWTTGTSQNGHEEWQHSFFFEGIFLTVRSLKTVYFFADLALF